MLAWGQRQQLMADAVAAQQLWVAVVWKQGHLVVCHQQQQRSHQHHHQLVIMT